MGKPFYIAKHDSITIPIYRNRWLDTRQQAKGVWRVAYIAKYRLHGVKGLHQIKRASLKDIKAAAQAAAEKIAAGKPAELQFHRDDAARWSRLFAKSQALGKSPELILEEYEQIQPLLPPGVSAKDCIHYYLKRNATHLVPATMADLVPLFLERKRANKTSISGKHLHDLENRLSRALTHFTAPIHTLIAEDFEHWLINLRDSRTGQLLGPQSRINYLAALQNFFNSKLARAHLPKDWNELAEVERPETRQGEVDFFTIEELTTLLYAAEGHLDLPTPRALERAKKEGVELTAPSDLQKRQLRELVPFLAIGAFGSTRNDFQNGEISELDWSKIDFKSGHLRMTDGIAKIGRRNIPLRDNLRDWLTPYAQEQGPVIPPHIQRTKALLCALTGILWKWNGLRRSCLTYDRALTGNSEAVAEKAGNSAKLVKQRYTEPMTLADGQRWANIRRPDVTNVLHLPTRGSSKTVTTEVQQRG